MTEPYDKQRRVGAGLIITLAQKIAKEAGIELIRAQIDEGNGITGRELHVLTMSTADRTARVELSDTELIDFPKILGLGPTLGKIRRSIDELV